MALIHRSEISLQRWINSTGFPPDGREHYRELKRYGNRHAVFERGSIWGTVHHDEHNGLDFPVGTVNHLAKYAHEKTGIHEGIARAALWMGAAYLGYSALRSR